MELNFLQAYAFTLAIEAPILYLILRREYGIKEIMKDSLIANTATIPLVWFVFPAFGLGYPVQIAISEIFAFGAEAGIYRFLFAGIKVETAVMAAFACNLVSFAAGAAIAFLA